jgi:hypothetical protein
MSKEERMQIEATLRTMKIKNTEETTSQVTCIDAFLRKLPRNFSNCAIFDGSLVLWSDS